MTNLVHTAPTRIEDTDRACTAPTVTTRRLLAAGAAAAPLFTVAAVAQTVLRQGYDITRHPVSVLANGDHGWVQTASFLLTGGLTLACAVGARRALRGGRAATWGPVLLAVQGFGMVIAGIFPMDPVDGFPVGTPAGMPTSMSSTAVLHNVGGSVSFLALIAACFVIAGRFRTSGQRGWARYGQVSGAAFIIGLGWAMTGGRAGALTLFLGVVIAWTWVAASAARLARRPVDR